MIDGQPEIRRIAPARPPPIGGTVAECPRREANNQLRTLKCPAVTIGGRRATFRRTIAAHARSIGRDAVEAVGTDIHPKPATRRSMAGQNRTAPGRTVRDCGVESSKL